MTQYTPPVRDMMFLINDVLGFESGTVDRETMEAILGEAAKLASEVLAPLNHTGDKAGAKLLNGVVTTAPGFKEAYKQYCEGGWNAVPFPEEFGGQGLPYAVAFPVQEMWQGANMAFGLCPLLNQGAVEAISHHGSTEQKKKYLPKLISGEWTGTMNLTEPQAGSDLGLIRTKAEKQGDGTYKISGQKIFITYGEHDYTDNIIHLVLARMPDAPEDVKGISLFIVPKFLEDGTHNTVQCIGLEHKLGIHASPTCTMEFAAAKGFLVGKENEGLKYMFTMMNNARLSVGLQGVAIAERALQKAENFANERTQGKSFKTGERVVISAHADVRRMLMTMKASVAAGRAMAYEAAIALDKKDVPKVEVLTPIVKAWCTDMACEVASLGVQVHGGMGFIEETGAAQYIRDARILPIYEGTNGIQAADLAFRKVIRDGGASARDYIAELKKNTAPSDREYFATFFELLRQATDFIAAIGAQKENDTVAAASTPYLKALGIVTGGALLSRAAARAEELGDKAFAQEKFALSKFFNGNILPLAEAYIKIAMKGSGEF
ncbi:MAG: acyl-CoA dehydrogenase [Alphaproteobacteria bacterium]